MARTPFKIKNPFRNVRTSAFKQDELRRTVMSSNETPQTQQKSLQAVGTTNMDTPTTETPEPKGNWITEKLGKDITPETHPGLYKEDGTPIDYPGDDFIYGTGEQNDPASHFANKLLRTQEEGGFMANPPQTWWEQTENFKDAAKDRHWSENMEEAYKLVTPDMSRNELAQVMKLYNTNKGRHKGDGYNFRLNMQDLLAHQKTLK
tara:strand:+ start:15 stop:629 length:615 start_codon:yes stop_codon:yes gene_type:complete